MPFRTGRGIAAVVACPPPWRELVFILVAIGLVRGLLESAYVLLRAGHLLVTLTQPYALRTYAVSGSAFLLANAVTALVRWQLFAFVAYVLGRWLGGRGRFRQLATAFGLAMGIYALTILPDYLYLFWTLPAIRFQVSAVYSPTIGIGQIAASLWLTWFGYATARSLHRLGRVDSLLVGAGLELVSLGSLVIGAQLFFNLPEMARLGRDEMVLAATAAFTLVAGAGGLVIWRLGWRMDQNLGGSNA
jgi:hypothetical protein